MKILVVDDEPSLLRLTSMLLVDNGHEVVTACSGKDALQIYEESIIQIDLVISDVVMPGMNGLKLAEWIRNSTKPVPVILMSGYPLTDLQVRIVSEAGKIKDCRFLQKPFTRHELLELITELAPARKMASSP